MPARFSLSQIKAMPNGRHRIERGLFLQVRDSRRSWIYQYSYHGKQYRLGLGSALHIPLATARELKRQAMAILLSGANPLTVRAEARRQARTPAPPENEITFRDFFLRIFPRITVVKNWKNYKHRQQWENTIKTYAIPIIGSIAVKDITREHVLAVLEPIWNTKTETANRLRARLETVLGYAIAEGLITGGNPATWKSNLDLFLPAPSSIQNVRHHPAVSALELKTAMSGFDTRSIRHCLTLFTILTASRIGESAPALWAEIDFEKKIWTVPASRRKDKRKEPHRVPLSWQAVQLLLNLPRCSRYVFASSYGDVETHVNVESPRLLLQDIFTQPVTMHGMRSTFRDWCAENNVNDIVAEKCLMHSVGNEVVQAYQRSDLLEQRRHVLQAWADYLLPRGYIVSR